MLDAPMSGETCFLKMSGTNSLNKIIPNTGLKPAAA